MRLFQLLVFIMAVGMLPGLAVAQAVDSTAASGMQALQLDSVWSMVIRLALTLGLIVAVIVGTVWLLKRVMARRWPGRVRNQPIHVLDRIQLAPKRSLDVVAVGERVLLLGVTETTISFLTELTPEEKGQFQPAATGQAGFKSVLSEAKTRMQQTFRQARAALPQSPATAKTTAEMS